MSESVPTVAVVEHAFSDPALLEAALTHSTWSHENGGPNNERLEFLGDAVLQLCVSRILYARFEALGEARMTEIRKRVVNNNALAGIARERGLAGVLRLGVGAAGKDGLRDNEKVLAGAVEALLGAVFLDAGIDAACAIVESWCGALLTPVEPPTPDAKNRLQERVQQKFGRPVYAVVDREGRDNEPTFTCEVRVADRVLGRGTARTKKEAERQAAELALHALSAEAE